jgi:predicted RecB family nuclease
VAKRLGYRWSHPEASAAQSIFWYATWLKTGERALLELAVEYNADDCRATRLLKDWLAEGPDAQLLPEASEPAAKWSQRARSPIPAGDR